MTKVIYLPKENTSVAKLTMFCAILRIVTCETSLDINININSFCVTAKLLVSVLYLCKLQVICRNQISLSHTKTCDNHVDWHFA